MTRPIDTAFNVSVKVPLPQPRYRALNRIADEQGMTVSELVGLIVGQALRAPAAQNIAEKPPRRRPGRYDAAEVRKLHSMGLNDVQIADRMGCNERTVRKYRDALDLPSNRRQGRPAVTTTTGDRR